MAENTPNLNLYLKDPLTDGNDTFNIETMLNENFRKIDTGFAEKPDSDQVILLTDKGVANGVASLDSTGKVQSAQSRVSSVNSKTGTVVLGSEDINKITAKALSDLPAAYPDGLSVFTLTATQAAEWRTATGHATNDLAMVKTSKITGGGSGDYAIVQEVQFYSATLGQEKISGVYKRASGANNSWKSGWVKLVSREEFTSFQNDVSSHLADETEHVKYGVATGSANTYALTLDPAPAAYVEGMAVSVKINANSTAASTLNINGLGVKGIKKSNGTDVTNLKANGIYTFRYDGTNFILQGEGGSGNAVASDLLSGKTASTDAGDITGSMPNNGALTITPSTTNQIIPAGYHNGSGIVQGDADLIAANIKSGANIFGIAGTLKGIKSIQTGLLSGLSSSPLTVTVSPVDINRSILLIQNRYVTSGTDATTDYVRGQITNSTTLTFDKSSSVSLSLTWTLIEFSNANVTRFGGVISDGSSYVDISVPARPTRDAGLWIHILQRTSNTSGYTTNALNVSWYADSIIRFIRGSTTGNVYFSVYIVEVG